MKYSSESIDKIVTALDSEKNQVLFNPKLKRIKVIEKLISRCSTKLDPRNLIIIRLKYNLIGLYGREPGYSTQVLILMS